LSNSPVIPKEQMSAYQRWELHAFDAPADQRPAATAKAADAAAAAEKVRHINTQAYEAGRADGLREGAQKAAHDTQSLAALLAAIESQSHENNQGIAHDVLEVALEVARQMLRQSLVVRPELIVPLIHDALARCVQPVAQATISLNPADATLVRELLAEELARGGWRIVEDALLARGGCQLHTAAIQIDASMETRWMRLAAALGQTSEWLA
jgi:flagellar assembly protein FliH